MQNYGKGLVTYITADMGIEEINSDNVSKAIEGLVHFLWGGSSISGYPISMEWRARGLHRPRS